MVRVTRRSTRTATLCPSRTLFRSLELVWSLRQSIELPRMQAARHQEVARALRRGGSQDRRLELGEPSPDHAAADRGDALRPQQDVAVQFLAPQVEEAVTEADILRIDRKSTRLNSSP